MITLTSSLIKLWTALKKREQTIIFFDVIHRIEMLCITDKENINLIKFNSLVLKEVDYMKENQHG